jgi:DNA polymerase
MSERSPQLEARLWLELFRDLGVEQLAPARDEPPVEPEAPASVPVPKADSPPVVREPASLIDTASPDADAIARAVAMAAEDPEAALDHLQGDVVGDCRRCKLCSGRTNVVYGVGSARARLMFIGEGPGADEDRKGEPFVGRAGQLLDRIIAAMGLSRPEVYIANIVKCRPPDNRDPERDEAETCRPFVEAQIRIIEPEVIVTLGKVPLQWLLRAKVPGITRVRGQWFSYEGIPAMATFHPAYLLRNPEAKRPVWEDMQAVMAKLGLERPR